ncbi:hypothetical protein BDZ89DRAFT_530045 [Hymenopellis radicata]|nr:hypothetical protein BDZ89DRAFT_530045 [Hymenopellis radicata]
MCENKNPSTAVPEFIESDNALHSVSDTANRYEDPQRTTQIRTMMPTQMTTRTMAHDARTTVTSHEDNAGDDCKGEDDDDDCKNDEDG